jgi:hypothetical protein
MNKLGEVELRMVLEKHRARGTTRVDVQHALWQAEKCVLVTAGFIRMIEGDKLLVKEEDRGKLMALFRMANEALPEIVR